MHTHRYKSIDALRAFAALAVLVFHYESLLTAGPLSQETDIQTLYSHLGLMGVELFFIISGFVILLTLDRNQSVVRFIAGRVGRIYPAYLVSVIFTGLFFVSIGYATVAQVATNLTLLQGFFNVRDLINPYWTLAYEIWFYALMSLVVKAGLLNSVDRLALAWLALAFTLRFLDVELGTRSSLLTLLQFGHLFIAGMMIYRITSGKSDAITLGVLALCVLYSAFGRNDWAHIPPMTYFVINGIFIAAVWAAASGRDFRTPYWLVAIGVCSYSLYLFHVPIGFMLAKVADAYGVSRWITVLASVLASLGFAFLSRTYIEVPGQRIVADLFAVDERRRMAQSPP
jgi:peptidoglycan/LPS O-acetylase OafA/YrhL